MKSSISIIAVDDHYLFLKGITDFFSQLSLVKSLYTCMNYVELMQRLQEEIPDIIFLDINLPPHNGFTICEEIKRKYPSVFVAILSQYDSEQFVQKARRCGAGAYFVKNTDPEILLFFLNCLAKDDIKGFFAHVPAAQYSKVSLEKDAFELQELLTCRERQVLKMIVNGTSHSEIENSLGITNSTFKMHKARIMQKLKLHNDIELGVFAIQHGLRNS